MKSFRLIPMFVLICTFALTACQSGGGGGDARFVEEKYLEGFWVLSQIWPENQKKWTDNVAKANDAGEITFNNKYLVEVLWFQKEKVVYLSTFSPNLEPQVLSYTLKNKVVEASGLEISGEIIHLEKDMLILKPNRQYKRILEPEFLTLETKIRRHQQSLRIEKTFVGLRGYWTQLHMMDNLGCFDIKEADAIETSKSQMIPELEKALHVKSLEPYTKVETFYDLFFDSKGCTKFDFDFPKVVEESDKIFDQLEAESPRTPGK